MSKLISYPKILNLEEIPEIKGRFCYIIDYYPEDGISVLVERKNDEVYITIGDWDSNVIDLSDGSKNSDLGLKFIKNYSSDVVSMMKSLNIYKLLFYLSVKDDEFTLVDLRASLDKFFGPGMIKDLFSKVIQTQNVIKVDQIDENLYSSLVDGKGKYNKDLILKCSVFKTVIRGKELLPLYAKIIRG